MKKLMCIVLIALLLGTAWAEEYLGSMEVVNCEEWVSLRATPDKSANRVVQVPLGAVVENCECYSQDWIYAEYDGRSGFILADYLEPAMQSFESETYPCDVSFDALAEGEEILRFDQDGYTVIATRQYQFAGNNESETLRVGCFRSGDEPVWGWVSKTNICTELSATEAFIGGTDEYAQVMIYNSSYGLTAVDFYDGTENWTLTDETVSLGASIQHAVDADGVIYIAGYYGPDPVAISMDGEVLWQSSVDDEDVYWPYGITTAADALRVNYDSCFEGGYYQAAFDYADGELLSLQVMP